MQPVSQQSLQNLHFSSTWGLAGVEKALKQKLGGLEGEELKSETVGWLLEMGC